jgi:hypothetical protein
MTFEEYLTQNAAVVLRFGSWDVVVAPALAGQVVAFSNKKAREVERMRINANLQFLCAVCLSQGQCRLGRDPTRPSSPTKV